jgi:hypothetical protein
MVVTSSRKKTSSSPSLSFFFPFVTPCFILPSCYFLLIDTQDSMSSFGWERMRGGRLSFSNDTEIISLPMVLKSLCCGLSLGEISLSHQPVVGLYLRGPILMIPTVAGPHASMHSFSRGPTSDRAIKRIPVFLNSS